MTYAFNALVGSVVGITLLVIVTGVVGTALNIIVWL